MLWRIGRHLSCERRSTSLSSAVSRPIAKTGPLPAQVADQAVWQLWRRMVAAQRRRLHTMHTKAIQKCQGIYTENVRMYIEGPACKGWEAEPLNTAVHLLSIVVRFCCQRRQEESVAGRAAYCLLQTLLPLYPRCKVRAVIVRPQPCPRESSALEPCPGASTAMPWRSAAGHPCA